MRPGTKLSGDRSIFWLVKSVGGAPLFRVILGMFLLFKNGKKRDSSLKSWRKSPKIRDLLIYREWVFWLQESVGGIQVFQEPEKSFGGTKNLHHGGRCLRPPQPVPVTLVQCARMPWMITVNIRPLFWIYQLNHVRASNCAEIAERNRS